VDVTSLREIKEEDAYRHIKYPFHLPPKERAGLSIKPAFIRTCHLGGGRRLVVYSDGDEANEADRKYPLLRKYSGFKGNGFTNEREQFYYCPSCKQVQVVFTERPDGGKYKSKNGCCAAKMAARKKKDQKIAYDPRAPLPINNDDDIITTSAAVRATASRRTSASSNSGAAAMTAVPLLPGPPSKSGSAAAIPPPVSLPPPSSSSATATKKMDALLSPPSSPGGESISSQSSADLPPPPAAASSSSLSSIAPVPPEPSPSSLSVSSSSSSFTFASTPTSVSTKRKNMDATIGGVSPAAVKRVPGSPPLRSLRDTFNAGRSGKRARVDADNSSSSTSMTEGEWTLTPSSYFWSELDELAQSDPFIDLFLLSPTMDISRRADLVVLFGGSPLERVRTATDLRVGTYRVAAKQITMRIAIASVRQLVQDNDSKNAPDAAPIDDTSARYATSAVSALSMPASSWCQISITVGSPSDSFVSWSGMLTIKNTEASDSITSAVSSGSSGGPDNSNGFGGPGNSNGFGGNGFGPDSNGPPPSSGGSGSGGNGGSGNFWLGFPSMSHFGLGTNLSLSAIQTLNATLAHYFAGDFDLRTGGRVRLNSTRSSRARHFYRVIGMHHRGNGAKLSSSTSASNAVVTPSVAKAGRMLFLGGEIAGAERSLEGAIANILYEVYRFYSTHYSHDADFVEAVLAFMDIALELGRAGRALFRSIAIREMAYHTPSSSSSSNVNFKFVFARRNGTMDAHTFTVTPTGTVFGACHGIPLSNTGVSSLDIRAFIQPLPSVRRIAAPTVNAAAPSTVGQVATTAPSTIAEKSMPVGRVPLAAALSETDLLTRGLDINNIRGRMVAQFAQHGMAALGDRSADSVITLARTILNELIGECSGDEKKRLAFVTDGAAQTLTWLSGKPSMMARVVVDASRELSDSKFLENDRGDVKTDQFAAIGLDYACYIWWKEFGERVSIGEEEFVRAVTSFMRSDIYVALGIQYTRNMTRQHIRRLYHLFTGNVDTLPLSLSLIC
jgi:hypothetical protein